MLYFVVCVVFLMLWLIVCVVLVVVCLVFFVVWLVLWVVFFVFCLMFFLVLDKLVWVRGLSSVSSSVGIKSR